MFKKFSLALFVTWLGLFVLAPFFIILWYSLTNPAGELTFKNFIELFTFPLYWVILQRSLWLASLSSFICLLFAYPMAWAMVTVPRKWRNVTTLLLITPMWINLLVRTYAWMKILGQNGPVNSLLVTLGLERQQLLYNQWAVLFGMVYNFFPFMVLPIYNSLRKIYTEQKDLMEASSDLGASSAYTFRKVILPLSLGGVASGVALVFIPSVTVFIISDLLGGAKNMLIGNLIEQQFFFARNWHVGSAASILLVAFVALIPLLRLLSTLRERFTKRRLSSGGVSS